MQRAAILHADLDAFYASVEQLRNPELRGKPVAVGGSVVLAASYEAKARGVQGGMPGWRARRLCPELIVVPGHFEEYVPLSKRVMEILGSYTPAIQQISIDEAFLDVGGSERLFGPPEVIAHEIRRRVRDEVGLPISVGVAGSKHLAKVASQVAKPDGLVIVPVGQEREFLDPLPVGLVWGVGPVTRERLHARGITTIGQLARSDPGVLERLLGGARGRHLSAMANDEDGRSVERGGPGSSVGAQSAFGRAEPTPDLVTEVLGHLSDRVAARLRKKARAGRTVTVRVRFPGMRSVTRSVTVEHPIESTLTLREVAESLVSVALAENPEQREVTLLAVSVSSLVDDPDTQLELGVDDDPHRSSSPTGAARVAVDRSMDAVRERFGRDAVGYASVALSKRRRVPDAFRELVERDRD